MTPTSQMNEPPTKLPAPSASARPYRPHRSSRVTLAGAAALLALLAGAQAQAQPAPASTGDLVGDWVVDLRPTPGSPAYLKPMRIAVNRDSTLSGTFYENSIGTGRATAGKGRACFAFTTRDGSGAYQTSGCRVGDRIEGQTWAEGRAFLLTWTATRDGAGDGTPSTKQVPPPA